MKFKLCFIYEDGSEDSLVVEGETIEEIREIAIYEKETREAKDAWSERLD